MLKVYDACNQRSAISFIDDVRRRLPVRIHVVQTDAGAEFQSQFHWHLERLDIRHVYIRPRTPHLNGKVERSHRVDDQVVLSHSMARKTPYERLVAKTRAGVSAHS